MSDVHPSDTTSSSQSGGTQGRRWHEQPPSTKEDWAREAKYHNSFLLHPDPILDRVVENNSANGLPSIAVQPAFGKFLNLTLRGMGAKNVVEVGTLGGYSTIWLARGLPDGGKVYTFEISEKHAAVARENFAAAGVSEKVEIVIGRATETLAAFQPGAPIDLVFIDADKESNPIYYKEAKRILRKDGIIIVDNMVRGGSTSKPEINDESVEGVRKLLQAVKDDPEVEATTISTVLGRGWDGFLFGVRK